MPKILLCIMPNYCYAYDHIPLGTPMLCGYLKEKNIEVIQVDYHMRYLDYWKRKVLPEGILPDISVAETAGTVRFLLNSLFDEKRKKSYYYSGLLPSDTNLLPYGDNTNSSFDFAEKLLSCEYLVRYIEDEKENTFLQFFSEEKILSQIEKDRINLVGISIISSSQVIAAFTLGYLIKKNLPNVHIVIGGQWPSLYREELKKRPDWRNFFDSIIIFEGETPLYNLILNLDRYDNLSGVPNLIYSEGNRWSQSRFTSKEDLNKLACPDFDGLALKGYAAAERTGNINLTYQTARECYWNRCIYCVDLPLPKQGYRERSMDLVIDDLKKLKRRYNMCFLEISNAVISPLQMKKLSQRILSEGIEFSWWCFARLESGFTKDIFDLAKKAGCSTVAFGLESGSQRVLDFIDKGVNLANAKRVIVDCKNAGIQVDLQLMMGLPSETLSEALDTVKFLIEYRDYITTATFNTYYVTPASRIYIDPSRYDISYAKYPNIPFKFFHNFSHISGELPTKRALNLINLYRYLLAMKKPKTDVPYEYLFRDDYRLSLGVGDDTVSFIYRFDKDKKIGTILDDKEVVSSV